MRNAIFFLIGFFFSTSLLAQGRIIIPELPPNLTNDAVRLRTVDANVTIRDGVSDVKLEQSFYNSSNRRLEGDYLFPLAQDAEIHDFYLYINGNKTKGQILDADEARQIYTDIVRRQIDPALMEYFNHGLFKARIFPIEPKKDRKIEINYAQVLQKDAGAYRLTFPISQSGQGKIDQFNLKIELQSSQELADIYSPSHSIEVRKGGNNSAEITLEKNNLEADKDVIIYYTLAEQDINATLLTFRPRTDRDGFFMFFATPQVAQNDTKQIAKDVVFVIDVSGSMQGEKIGQARSALKFCLNQLNDDDRFEIISFSSSLNSFQNGLKRAAAETKSNARYFIDNLNANGGTNINAALLHAQKLKRNSNGRVSSIIFLTDGLPTEGETEVTRIVQNVTTNDRKEFRIFSFGVGYDVNTFLLDKISQETHGDANYVKPGENIEREVSNFFAKISSPVLSNPEIDFNGLSVYDVYPQKLPDMFNGQRVIVLGRYRSADNGQAVITGTQGSRQRTFEYPVNLNRRETENGFISKLWANRKVAHLMNQIRFEGENEELVNSVKALGREYGIVTPYTSYLVREQEEALEQVVLDVRDGRSSAFGQQLMERKEAMDSAAEADEEAVGSTTYLNAVSAAPKAAAQSSGKGAVMSSRVMKKMGQAQKLVDMLITHKRIGLKSFQLKNGIWTDLSLASDVKTTKQIEFLSNEYFELAKQDRMLARILALGQKVLFEWDGAVYQINALTQK